MKRINNKSKEKDQSVVHIIKNTWYMTKLLLKYAPDILIVDLITTVVGTVIGFLQDVWILQYVINGFQEGMSFEKALLAVIIVSGVSLIFNVLCSAYDTFRSNVVSLKIERQLNLMVYDIASRVEIGCYEDKKFYDRYVKASGDFVNRVWNVKNSVSGLLSLVLSVGMYSFFIFTLDPVLIVFAVFPLVVNFIMGKRQNNVRHQYDMAKREEERQREYTRRTFYLVDYAKEMRITNMYKVMFERFDNSCRNIIGYIKQYGWRLAIIDYIIRESREVVASMGAMLYAVYSTLVVGTMKYGDCLVVINSVENLIWSLSNSVNVVMRFHENSLYVDTIREFLEYEPKIKDGKFDAPETGSLEFKNVTFKYTENGSEVLKNINLKVNNGEKIALVGHNGAGKSTIAKLMLRLYDPVDGNIYYGGEDVRSYRLTGKDGYRNRISAVFQDFRIFSFSVAENVLIDRCSDEDIPMVIDAINKSGMAEKIDSFKNGIHTVLTREFDPEGEVLSGGEGQKISIARTFAANCGLIILDEPTSALDPVAEYKMYENMMKAGEGKSVVFISHRLSSATLADRIYYIENGEVIEEGNHVELMAQNGKYAKMFRIQAENYAV